VPQLLWNKTFDKGGITWRDFGALIKLRNDHVHYIPRWENPGYVPDYLRSIYQRISPQTDRSSDSGSFMEDLMSRDASFVARICNIEMGQWALNAAEEMIGDLFRLWPRRDMMRADYIFMFERSGINVKQ